MNYEKLLQEASCLEIRTFERPMPKSTKGLYAENVIWINKTISATNEKSCVLAEELGHYHTTVGDILDQSSTKNKKQEKQARSWAHKKLVPLERIIDAYKEGINSKYELSDYLEVTEGFLLEAIKGYKGQYGTHVNIKNYTIFFEPLAVYEALE